VVGRLKGLVRVMMTEDEPPLLLDTLMKQLLKPEKYCVRLYALTGKGLAAMDFNMAGQPANSDPYLKVQTTLSYMHSITCMFYLLLKMCIMAELAQHFKNAPFLLALTHYYSS